MTQAAAGFFYFAYGSNMLAARLRRRCPSARPIGVARVEGFAIAFDKRGMDGSGKATLYPAPQGIVHGVVFEIDAPERENLDLAEGPGYARHDDFSVSLCESGATLLVSTYIARPDARHDGLSPFDWYRGLILAGAVENALPEAEIGRFAALACVEDPLPERAGRLEHFQRKSIRFRDLKMLNIK